MVILLLFPLIAIICMITLGYKFVRSKGSVIVSIYCIMFGIAHLYGTYLLAGILWAFGCGMGNGQNCHPTWKRLNEDSSADFFYFVASFGTIYIFLGCYGILHKLYKQYRPKNNNTEDYNG